MGLSGVACKPALTRLAHALRFMFCASGSRPWLQTEFKQYLSRISDKKRRAVPMRTRENTRKCMALRDKRK
jgi:hypothetical protein